jgi:hypothetical protein
MLRLVLALFRNVNFTRAILVPFLLVCLACATPFPIENLKEGMTAESVREEFGAPKAEEAISGSGATSCWTYWHEEQNWIATLLLPAWLLVIPMNALSPGVTWDAWYFNRNSVFLHFEEEKLVGWGAIEPVMKVYSVPDSDPHTDWGDTTYLRSSMDDPPTCSKYWEAERPTEPIPFDLDLVAAPAHGEQYIPDLEWCQKSCDNDHSGWCGLCDEEYPDWRADL